MIASEAYIRLIKAINNKQKDAVLKFLEDGILNEVGDANSAPQAEDAEAFENYQQKIEIYKALITLQDFRIAAFIAKKETVFPAEILNQDFANTNLRKFVAQFLKKYLNKFDLKNEDEGGRVFETACICNAADVIKTMLYHRQGEEKLYRLATENPDLMELFLNAHKDALTPDMLVKIYTEAALSLDYEDRIKALWELGLDINAKNEKGQTAYDAVMDVVENGKFAKNKNGTIRKTQFANAAKVLRKYMAQPTPKKKLRPLYKWLIVVAAAVVLGCGITVLVVAVKNPSATEVSGSSSEDGEALAYDSNDPDSGDTSLGQYDYDVMEDIYNEVNEAIEESASETSSTGTSSMETVAETTAAETTAN